MLSSDCLAPMTCPSSDKRCQCSMQKYYVRANLSCVDRTLNNTACTSDNTCRVDLGLSCQANLCQCDSTKQFWHSTQGKLIKNKNKKLKLNKILLKGKCIDYMTYGAIGCTTDSHCQTSKGLICNLNPLNNKCDCPLSSVTGMCDCKRVVGEEFYWDGSQCIRAASYGISCNSSMNRTCQVLYEPLFCRSGFCSLLFNGEECSANIQCDFYKNFTCISGTCKTIKLI